MTGLDGLVEARARQISDVVRRSGSRSLIPGEDRATRRTTLGEKALAVLGTPEEVITKAIGNVISDDPKYDWKTGVGGYHTQTSFADIFRDSGVDPTSAAILGIAAAIANPLDPFNKLQIGKLTKVGRAARAVETAGDNLVKGSDNLWRISTDKIVESIAATKKNVESGQLVGDLADAANASIRRHEESLRHADELNEMLIELQQRGVDVKNLKSAGSFAERVASGQQHLIGFSSPRQFDQLSLFGLGRGPNADTSIFGVGGKKVAALIRGIGAVKNKIVKPLKDAAYKMADYIGVPTVRSDLQKTLNSQIKTVLDHGKADVAEIEANLLNIYQRFIKSYGPEGAEAAKNDLLAVLQAMELKHTGAKEMAIDAIAKVDDYVPIQTGKDVVVESGSGLSDQQKLRLTQSGIDDAEIPVAVKAFDTANVPSIRVGKLKEHEAKVLGKYVVVKTSDPKAALSALDELDGVYGNRVWAKQTTQDGTYLVQKRHPGASRITKTSDFQPEHLRNLEVIAAQLSHKQKGFTALGPEDVLVSPSGAVQIINPSVIVDYKSAKQAVANSRQALESLADTLAVPRGAVREMPALKNAITARNVPKGVDSMAFRVARGIDAGEELVYVPAHDLLEQAVNTAGHRDLVRASYDQLSPEDFANTINANTPTYAYPSGIPEFERANNIEFYRQQIRKAIAEGRDVTIEPISIVKDDLGNMHIASGRDRLVAAILEGYEAVPIYKKNFIGDAADLEQGFYVGRTIKLTDSWNVSERSSARGLHELTGGLVSTDYSVINRNGDVVKVSSEQLQIHQAVATLFNKMLTAGPQFVGKARTTRIESAVALLKANFGSVRNAMLHLTEIAEASPDIKAFTAQLEKMLVNKETGKGIVLDNFLRHAHAEDMFMQLKAASTVTLDSLAANGIFTASTVRDPRRLLAATDNDTVIQVIDRQSNTLRVYSNQATTDHLRKVADEFLNSVGQADDIEPYARIELVGADGVKKLEVKDFVTGQHPRIADVLEPVKVFTISDEHRKLLKKEGILVHDGKDAKAAERLAEFFPKAENGRSVGVLLNQKERAFKSTKTGQFVEGLKETVVVRPEFAFFVTRSGAVVVSTKQKNVKDLLETIFEEGPAYFEEFGVMTTGRVVISNPFGSKMNKIGVGEVRLLEDRLKALATRFKELGLDSGTLMQVRVPFDDAVWRAMYGERVTIGDILSDKFRLKIPENLKGHVPDIRILAPGRVGGDAKEMGIVGLEKTRLANKKMQELFDTLTDLGDELFLQQAKAGLPISYYASWFGRHLTTKAKEALNEAWLKFPDKESKTFKNLESVFNKRVLTDLTTQEVNTVIRRLKKEGVENADSIISDVVSAFRDGYVLKPTPETAAALVALSKITPEGIDFFHTDPIWSAALSARGATRAVNRKEIVDSIKSLGVAVWSGSPAELEKIKIGKSKKFLELKSEIKELDAQLTQAQLDLERLADKTPDIQGRLHAELSQRISELTEKLASKNAEHLTFLQKIGNGKVLDTMVDLESEQLWIRGEDVTRLIDDGVIKQSDIIGDAADAFVRIPAKKYASVLDPNNAEVFLFTKEVEPVIQRYFQTTTKDGFGKFLQLWDTVHSVWRNWTLFPIPAYHVRNLIGNMFMAHLGGVTDARAYSEAFNILGIVDAHRKGGFTKKQVQEALGAISFSTATGQVISGQQVYDEFVRHGGFAGGVHYNEFNSFGSMSRASEFEHMSVKAGLRPSSELAGSLLTDNTALRLGVSAAAYVENRFRMAAFLDSLTKGHTEVKDGVVLAGFEAAAINMKRIFYDYSDLSVFERSWLRRVIPFYSWSRHNIPRMLETLVTNPIVHYRLSEFFHEVEVGANGGVPVEENAIPEWLSKRFGLVTDKTKEGNYIVKTGDGFIPMIDAYKMLAGGSVVQMVKDGLTPFFKVPIEQLLNYSMYSEKPIEQYAGQRAASFTLGELGFSRRSTTEGPLGILNLLMNESMFRTFFRPGGEVATKIIDPIFDGKEGPGFKLFVYALFLGRAYEVNPQQARMAIYNNWETRQRQLLNLRNQALQEGDTNAADDAMNMINWLRLQYPGVREL